MLAPDLESPLLRRCPSCLVEKDTQEFYLSQGGTPVGACKACKRLRARRWYAEHREHRIAYDAQRGQQPGRRERERDRARRSRAEHPQKHRARAATRRAVKAGRLAKTPCVICGNPNVQAHHPDYGKPLHVVWVCQRCHKTVVHGGCLA